MKGPYVKYWNPARDGEAQRGKAGKEDQCGLAKSPRAQEAVQRKGRETDKPEAETEKQPQMEGRDQKDGSPAAAFPGGPTRQPPAVRMGGGSQARATGTQLRGRRKPFQTGGWVWKCQSASQVAMATETKREAEKRLGQRPMRGPSCWWSLGKPQLSLLDRSSGLGMGRQPCRRASRFSSIQVPGPPMLLTCLSLNFPIC